MSSEADSTSAISIFVGIALGFLVLAWLEFSYPRWFANAATKGRFGWASYFAELSLSANERLFRKGPHDDGLRRRHP